MTTARPRLRLTATAAGLGAALAVQAQTPMPQFWDPPTAKGLWNRPVGLNNPAWLGDLSAADLGLKALGPSPVIREADFAAASADRNGVRSHAIDLYTAPRASNIAGACEVDVYRANLDAGQDGPVGWSARPPEIRYQIAGNGRAGGADLARACEGLATVKDFFPVTLPSAADGLKRFADFRRDITRSAPPQCGALACNAEITAMVRAADARQLQGIEPCRLPTTACVRFVFRPPVQAAGLTPIGLMVESGADAVRVETLHPPTRPVPPTQP